jgi:TRAP-type C4-dicarboxylate transport system permease small subunit
MRHLLDSIYAALAWLAMAALAAAFGIIALGVLARQLHWDIQGLDGYAGYAIAAALFLALPATFQRNEHIRVTLLMEKVSERWRRALQVWSLLAASALSLFLAWSCVRLVWMSRTTHDIAQTMDATPLWLPQMSLAIGAAGLALACLDATASHLAGRSFFKHAPAGEAARVE